MDATSYLGIIDKYHRSIVVSHEPRYCGLDGLDLDRRLAEVINQLEYIDSLHIEVFHQTEHDVRALMSIEAESLLDLTARRHYFIARIKILTNHDRRYFFGSIASNLSQLLNWRSTFDLERMTSSVILFFDLFIVFEFTLEVTDVLKSILVDLLDLLTGDEADAETSASADHQSAASSDAHGLDHITTKLIALLLLRALDRIQGELLHLQGVEQVLVVGLLHSRFLLNIIYKILN